MKNLNLDAINISFHGHIKSIHENWTQAKGSFKETLAGIKNLTDSGCSVTINHILWKKNFFYLDKFLDFISSLGVFKCVILNLNPIGRAEKNYRFLKVDLLDLLFLNKVVLKWEDEFKQLTCEDFPFCLFNPEIHRHKKIVILNTSGELSFSNEGLLSSYGCARAKSKGIDIFSNLTAVLDINKLKKSFLNYTSKNFCFKCKFINQCDGIFTAYFNQNHEKTIREILILRSLNRV